MNSRELWASLPMKLKIMMVTMIVANIGGGMFYPFMALYVRELGADVSQVGLFFTMAAVAPAIFNILGGWVSDNLGRVQTVAIGALIGLVGYFGMWLAPTWYWLIPGELFTLLAAAFIGPSFRAYIGESAPEGVRAQAFALSDAVFLVCQMIGPPLGGYIAMRGSYHTVLTGLLVFVCIAAVLRVWNARDVPFHLHRVHGRALRESVGGIAGLIIGGGLLTFVFMYDVMRDFAFSLSINLIPLIERDIGNLTDTQIGWLPSFDAAVSALFLTQLGKLTDRFGERKMMAAGSLVGAAAFAMFALAQAFTGYIAAAVLLGLSFSCIMPATESLLSKAVPKERLGMAYGVFAASINVFCMPAPALGALAWEHMSPQTPFWLSAALYVLIAPFAYRTLHTNRPVVHVEGAVTETATVN